MALLLALVPATAFADGAGDNQYQDPLAAPTAPKKPKKKATTTPATTPSTTSAPAATTTPSSSQQVAPASSSASPTSSSQQQLPRTGAPAGLIGLGGLALIASGAALRRRTASQ